jgi:protein gp37
VAENSKIEWTHHTMNFWLGCTALSPACDHCYAEGWAKRTGNAALWQGERRRTSAALWRQPAKWDAACAEADTRQRVFTNSLADFFDNQVPAEWRHDAWAIIAGARHLDWMVLTKRPENIVKMLPVMDSSAPGYRPWNERWPWRNVWLGTTIEDRARLHRLDKLRAAPAAVRFLSIEPLLEDLGQLDLSGIHLVIVGGESGPRARPLNPAWVRSLRDQCAAQGVAFFLKQWGEWADMATARIAADGPVMTRTGIVPNWMDRAVTFEDGSSARLRGHTFTGHGTDLVYRVGKKAAGRLLDGVEHSGFPEVTHG